MITNTKKTAVRAVIIVYTAAIALQITAIVTFVSFVDNSQKSGNGAA